MRCGTDLANATDSYRARRASAYLTLGARHELGAHRARLERSSESDAADLMVGVAGPVDAEVRNVNSGEVVGAERDLHGADVLVEAPEGSSAENRSLE